MKIAYILENRVNNWLKYEVDAMIDLGVELSIYPNNPALYRDFDKNGNLPARSISDDIFDAARLVFKKPMESLDLFSRVKEHVGTKIAITGLSLASRLRETDTNLLFAHFASGPAASAWMVSRLTGLPFGFTAHAYDIFKNSVDRDFLKEKCEDASFVRCISEYNKRYLVEITGIGEEKFPVIHCGLDTERFKPRSSDEIRYKSGNIILVVANLVPKKGLKYLIEALSSPMLKELGARAIILGDGPLRGKLKVLTTELGADVKFMGNISNEELGYYYDSATVFVLPCVKAPDGDMDGIPVALMEAMASGIPVVSTNISGIPELIEDGKGGILVPEKDPKALAQAIKGILTDSDARKRFSVEGRKKVIRDFDIRDVARRLHNLFTSHVSERGR